MKLVNICLLITLVGFTMICPECKKEGKKSTVTVGSSTTTLMAPASYYDEDGNYHYHDPNYSCTTLICSNGHIWEVCDNEDEKW